MELTKAEIELIQEKRANDLDLRKATAIALANKTIADYLLVDSEKSDAYNKYVNLLNEASMSKGCGTRLFDLVVTEFEHSETPSHYDNETNRVNLEPIKCIRRRFEIKFLGETVETEHSYYLDEDGDERIDYRGVEKNTYKKINTYFISVEKHITGHGFGSLDNGFKMNISGLLTDKNSRRDNGKNITNPKTVITKIKEDIDMRKRAIENKIRENSLKDRAINEAKTMFPNAKISEYDNRITATFENGTSIECRYYDENDGVKFVTDKVHAYGVDPIALGNILQTLSKK